MPNDLDSPPEVLLNPALATARVALVNPQVFDAGEGIGGSCQEQGHASTILNVCGVHLHPQDQTLAIYQNVALATVDAFGAIVAAHATDPGCSHRLAVDNPGARLRVTPNTRAELLTDHVVEMLPCTVQAPAAKLVVSGLPGRKLVRQQPPGATSSHDVEDGVQDLAQRMKPRTADTPERRQERIQASELCVRQIGQVWSPRGDIPAILPLNRPTARVSNSL